MPLSVAIGLIISAFALGFGIGKYLVDKGATPWTSTEYCSIKGAHETGRFGSSQIGIQWYGKKFLDVTCGHHDITGICTITKQKCSHRLAGKHIKKQPRQ